LSRLAARATFQQLQLAGTCTSSLTTLSLLSFSGKCREATWCENGDAYRSSGDFSKVSFLAGPGWGSGILYLLRIYDALKIIVILSAAETIIL